ncbi:Uncharacterized protein FWK35_00011115, partial [Aphis craccivora]
LNDQEHIEPKHIYDLIRVFLYILDSERSDECDECINFTMKCVFFMSVYSITNRKNASISNYGSGFQWKTEYLWCIIEVKKKQKKKNDGKTGILRKTSFRPNRFFIWFVDNVPYEFSNFYEIYRKRENLQRNVTIYPQMILNICYYSKSISRRYLKISPTTGIFNFSENFFLKFRITSRNNAPILNYGGGFRCKSEYPWCIIEVKSKQFSKKSRKTKKK